MPREPHYPLHFQKSQIFRHLNVQLLDEPEPSVIESYKQRGPNPPVNGRLLDAHSFARRAQNVAEMFASDAG